MMLAGLEQGRRCPSIPQLSCMRAAAEQSMELVPLLYVATRTTAQLAAHVPPLHTWHTPHPAHALSSHPALPTAHLARACPVHALPGIPCRSPCTFCTSPGTLVTQGLLPICLSLPVFSGAVTCTGQCQLWALLLELSAGQSEAFAWGLPSAASPSGPGSAPAARAKADPGNVTQGCIPICAASPRPNSWTVGEGWAWVSLALWA